MIVEGRIGTWNVHGQERERENRTRGRWRSGKIWKHTKETNNPTKHMLCKEGPPQSWAEKESAHRQGETPEDKGKYHRRGKVKHSQGPTEQAIGGIPKC